MRREFSAVYNIRGSSSCKASDLRQEAETICTVTSWYKILMTGEAGWEKGSVPGSFDGEKQDLDGGAQSDAYRDLVRAYLGS